jgi:hypothetical protein
MPLPKGMKTKVKTVFNLMGKLMSELCTPSFTDVTLEGAAFDRILFVASLVTKLEQDTTRALYQALSCFQGKGGVEVVEDICWRLAAGKERIVNGEELRSTFTAAEPPHWCLIFIEDIYRAPSSKKGTQQLKLHMRILSGPYAGLSLQQTMAYDFVMWRFMLDIGFKREDNEFGNDQRSYRDAVQGLFVGEIGWNEDGQRAEVREFDATTSTKASNKQLRTSRLTCIREYPDMKCRVCPLGYKGKNACPQATHRYEFVERPCSACGNEHAYFDPSRTVPICLVCETRESRRKN